METSKTKRRLKKKLNAPEEVNIFDMLNQVNQLLKQNPDMLKQVNKCVSGIIDNPTMMASLTSQIFDTKSDKSEAEASGKESIQ